MFNLFKKKQLGPPSIQIIKDLIWQANDFRNDMTILYNNVDRLTKFLATHMVLDELTKYLENFERMEELVLDKLFVDDEYFNEIRESQISYLSLAGWRGDGDRAGIKSLTNTHVKKMRKIVSRYENVSFEDLRISSKMLPDLDVMLNRCLQTFLPSE